MKRELWKWPPLEVEKVESRLVEDCLHLPFISSYLVPSVLIVSVLLGAFWLRFEGTRWIATAIFFGLVVLGTFGAFAFLVVRNNLLVQSLNERNEESRRAMQMFCDELNAARAEAVDALKSKSAFLANMSHEIRTPMNAVIGCSDMLRRTALTPEQQRLVDIIISSGSGLVDIINDVLMYSKIEAGKFDLHSDRIGIVQLVETTVDLLADKAANKGISLTTFVSPDANIQAIGDSQRLRQVLLNLVSNAVKFTATGSIDVRAELLEEADGKARILFSVRDTGIGISEEHLEKLFQPFSQCDASITRKYGGTGLGLAISKRLVELMDGSFRVQSQLGAGSTFEFTVTLARAGEQKNPTFSSMLAGMNMLVVGTLYGEFEVIRSYGCLWSMEVDYAPDWESALSLIDRGDASTFARKYHIVICNESLKGTSVKAFAQAVQLRQPSVKFMLLSPLEGLSDRFELSLSGISCILTKPLHQSALLDCLQFLFEGSDTERARIEATEVLHKFGNQLPTAACKRILVVEDNQINQQVIRMQLDELGFVPHIASNGQEALAALENTQVALVLMDCQMPIMDGFEATRRIRLGEKQTRVHVPVIAMTANAMEGDREACLASGMDDYVSKPLTADKLQEVIERWLLVAMDDEEPEPPQIVSPVEDVVEPNRVSLETTVANKLWTQLSGLYGPAAVNKLLKLFAEQTPALLHKLSYAMHDGDPLSAREAAHELKGSAAALRIEDIQKVSAEIEALARNDQLDRIADKLLVLEAQFEGWRRLIELVIDDEEKPKPVTTKKGRLFLVEDNELTRTGLKALLQQANGFEIAGEAADGRCVQKVLEAKPDLVLVDIGLPGASGIEVTRRIKAWNPEIKAMMFTSHDDENDMFESFSAGADGYIIKHDFDSQRLQLAINTVLSGNCWLDPSIARRVLQFASRQRVAAPVVAAEESVLTREEELVLTNAECSSGACSIDPAFLTKLQRFSHRR